MKRLLIFIVALLVLPLWVGAKGVTYFKGTIYEALEEASRTGRMLLVEFYAPWNYKSRWAHDNMLTQSDLTDKFVVFSLETTSPEGAALASTYEVFDYPNMLVFNKNGNVIDRIDRTLERVDFDTRLSQMLLALDSQTTLQLRQIYAAAAADDKGETNHLVRRYLSSVDSDFDVSAVMDLFTSSSINYYGSASFDYMVANRHLFDSIFVQDKVAELLIEAMLPYIGGVVEFDSVTIASISAISNNFKCKTLIEKLVVSAVARDQNQPILFIQTVDNLSNKLSKSYLYSLVLAFDFIDVGLVDKSTKRIACRVIEGLLVENTSQSKNVVIESLLTKFL